MRKTMAALVLGAVMLAGPAAAVQAQGGSAPAVAPLRVSLDFPGGTMSEYVDAIRASARGMIAKGDESVNVILRNDAGTVPIGAVRLTNVTVNSALRAACPQRIQMPDGSVIMVSVHEVDGEVIVVEREDARPPRLQTGMGQPASSVEEQDVEILPIGELIRPQGGASGIAVPSIIASITEASALADGERATTIKFHPDTSLLFVLGSERQLALARQTVGLLEDSQRRSAISSQEESGRASDLRMRMIDLEMQMQRARIEMELAVEERDFARKLVEQGGISSTEVARMEAKLRMQETEFMGLERQAGEVHRRLDELSRKDENTEVRYSTPELSGSMGPSLAQVAAVIADGSPMSIDGPAFVIRATPKGHERLSQALTAMTRAVKKDPSLTMPEGWVQPVQPR